MGEELIKQMKAAFNPTMVRLLHENYEVRAPLPHFFQSHNGAIAAQPLLSPHSPIIRLSIPQWCDCCQIKKAWVKLGDGLSIPQWCDCCCDHFGFVGSPAENFQSHNGAIAALLRKVSAATSILTFNPTMVRLLLEELKLPNLLNFNLSIPQWCDCCPNCRLLPLPSGRTFNPTMVRLLLRLSGKFWRR